MGLMTEHGKVFCNFSSQTACWGAGGGEGGGENGKGGILSYVICKGVEKKDTKTL